MDVGSRNENSQQAVHSNRFPRLPSLEKKCPRHLKLTGMFLTVLAPSTGSTFCCRHWYILEMISKTTNPTLVS
ncbi:hypothetical protein PR048_018269 [Dryococelus australis]|uniref:Uncharacterized protein n=1 Tax=Dryococelus australis TaxID=614101 RepID=A0ABQ9HCI4_9NEOP|nr:hypothetical protein PR048_018269 [Dryococelus australis]